MTHIVKPLQTMPIGILQQTNKVIAYEFFSGIGGFHAALKTSCNGRVKKAFEISPKCIKVYLQNFPETKIVKKTIDSLKIVDLQLDDEEDASLFLWLLSPPCQPFTRSRRSEDAVDDKDNRTTGFLHLIENLLTKICNSKDVKNRKPDIIFVENVVGYEKSRTRVRVLKILVEQLGYKRVDEYILDSHDFGIPNQRPRYYGVYTCRNKKKQMNTNNEDIKMMNDNNQKLPRYSVENNWIIEPILITKQSSFPFDRVVKTKLSEYLDETPIIDEIPEEIMQKAVRNHIRYDISLKTDNISACLSKGYGKFPRGYGPLLLYKIDKHAAEKMNNDSDNNNNEKNDFIEYQLKINVKQNKSDEKSTNNDLIEKNRRHYYIVWRQGYHIRYFTPRECLRLLYFPKNFVFPQDMKNTEKLSLCGNSLNVKVVSEILKKTLKEILI